MGKVNLHSQEREKRERLARCYFTSGVSIKEVAKKLKVSETCIRGYLNQENDEWLYLKHYYHALLDANTLAKKLKLPVTLIINAFEQIEKMEKISP